MDGDRSNTALARIEAALGRIEAAAAQPCPLPVAAAPLTDDMAHLQQRHDQLRGTVEDVLAELDQLIAGAPLPQPDGQRG